MTFKFIIVAFALLASHANADRMFTRRQLQQSAPGAVPKVSQQPSPIAVTPQQTSVVVQRQPATTVLTQQQVPVILVPSSTAACTTIKDADMPRGSLCVSQAITTTTSAVVCNSYDSNCIKTTAKTAIVTPSGDAYSNPTGFQASADAACKVLGYTAAGSGSVHMSGNNAKKNCWNGQTWANDNYWVSLVCCK